MLAKVKIFISLLFPFLIIYYLKFLDKKTEGDFNNIVEQENEKVQSNLSNELRGGLNLNNKIRYIVLSQSNETYKYIKYKLRYTHSYITKEGYPEKIFYYYK